MNKSVPEKVTDITDIELSPGKPNDCLGNGDQGYECCCDECDYFFLCYPGDYSIDEEELYAIEIPPPSKRHRIRMNRMFRERVGSSFLPFPEVDCLYERVRSKIVVKLKINEFLDKRLEKRKKRRRKKRKNTRS